MKIKMTLAAVSIFFTAAVFAQNTRMSDKNTIGWYNSFATFKVSGKWSIHTEYQWRRTKLIEQWQQSLLRLGVNYQPNAKLQLRLGYGWIETFAYGDYPINGLGKNFTEHRIFEAATISDKINKIELSHRFMLEQRWLGRYSNAVLTKEDEFVFANRFRYMYRMQIPLKGKTIADKTPYAALYDEIFLGFGKNVNQNVFDQNRAGFLLGYRFNKKIRVEGGYFNQIVQLGRTVNNRNVFQYNNGVIMNAFLNFDFTKK